MRLDTWQRQISPVNMRKGLIFGCLLILLLGGTTPAGARWKFPQPSAPGDPEGGDQAAAAPQVELPNTTGPIITDLATTQAYKTWTLQVTPTLNLTGGGACSFTWGIDVFKYLPEFPVLLYANLWFTNLTDGWVNGARVIYPDQITLNLAMEIPFKKSPDNRWAFLLEVLSLWDAGRMFGPRANQAPLAVVSVLPALEFLPCKWFTLAAGVQVPLIGRNTTYNCAPTLALYFNF